MQIDRDIIMRALCHRLSIGGTRHVSLGAGYLVRADFDGLLINDYRVHWNDLDVDFLAEHYDILLPIINNVRCCSVFDAPWMFECLLEHGAACYTHNYQYMPKIEIKEYIMPGNYKFSIVKYQDIDTHFVVPSHDLKYLVRELNWHFLSTCQIAWYSATEEFKQGYGYGLDDITVCWDSHRINQTVVLHKYNTERNRLKK